MGLNNQFRDSLKLFVEDSKADMEEVVRRTGINILGRLVDMSPVGNPETWAINQTASQYNQAVYEANEAAKQDPANLTKTGRLKKKARISDSMDIKTPPGYTGGRFKGNWQIGLDQEPSGETGRIDPSGGMTTAQGNANLAGFKVGMKAIFFVNNVPYAYALEVEGHSMQAPEGMIRIVAKDVPAIVRESIQEVKQ
ncbi:hypothetical protein EYZ01_05295 [Hafnia alvei]|uniref:hypothetical protein n=1 Tax=Hafnia alvei TaxID=569 RepID=UPI0010332F68|nr:hypothetical protein [Hafnia alvei]TBL40748.1 hypothetical protein EYZ01_05295 [Hafnia alvei]